MRPSSTNAALIVAAALALLLSACTGRDAPPPIHSVSDFTLTERNGETVSLESLKGQVWVAHFMFTRCEGPCPRMVAEMKSLKRSLGPEAKVKWVSISADPSYDTPEVLQTYAKRFTQDTENWLFLTGDASEIYTLAESGFLLPVTPGAVEAETLITHSLKMAVIDKEGQIRAYLSHFEDTNEAELKALIGALN